MEETKSVNPKVGGDEEAGTLEDKFSRNSNGELMEDPVF